MSMDIEVGQDYVPRDARVRVDAVRRHTSGRQLVRYVAADGRRSWLDKEMFIRRFIHVLEWIRIQEGGRGGKPEAEVLGRTDTQ